MLGQHTSNVPPFRALSALRGWWVLLGYLDGELGAVEIDSMGKGSLPKLKGTMRSC